MVLTKAQKQRKQLIQTINEFDFVVLKDTSLIIGFDPGLNRPGVCLMDRQGNMLESFCFERVKNASVSRHLRDLSNGLAAIVKDHVKEDKPNILLSNEAVTVAGVGSSFKSAMALAYSLGTVLSCPFQTIYGDDVGVHQIQFVGSSLKKAIASNGRADKVEIMKSIQDRFDISFTDDNMADAYVAARMGHLFTHFIEMFLRKVDQDPAKQDASLIEFIKSDGYSHMWSSKEFEVITDYLYKKDFLT